MAHARAGRPVEAAPVKFIAAILAGPAVDLAGKPGGGCPGRSGEFGGSEDSGCCGDSGGSPLEALERLLGGIDYRSEPHPFTMTDYYDDEMGPGLARTIVSFEPLRSATELVRIKLATAEIERTFERGGRRTINVDPGYVDYFKIVLASFKEAPQKIYLGSGVWADPVMMYQDGALHVLPWTFPDFKAGIYADDLTAIRRLYKDARRNLDRRK